MFSVELAALKFFQELGLPFELLKAQYKPWYHVANKLQTPRFEILKHCSDFKKYDTVVYWGDFLNNPVFGFEEFARRDFKLGHSESKLAGFDRWKSLYLPNSSSPGTKWLSLGNNFQNVNIDTLSRLPGAQDIFDGFDLFDAIVPRDSVSQDNIENLFPRAGKAICSGMDLAFALDLKRLAQPVHSQEASGQFFGYFFGRSNVENASAAIKFLEQKTGVSGVNLSAWLSMSKLRPQSDFLRIAGKILKSKFVISDTYHLLINSLNLGVPVIGLGGKAEFQDGSCGDFKKLVLFDDLGLSKYYLLLDSSNRLDLDELQRLLCLMDPVEFESVTNLKKNFRVKIKSLLASMAA